MHRRERNEHLKSNIRYLIKSRGETQLSLCNASGLTRTTIYNILEGRVTNVHEEAYVDRFSCQTHIRILTG